MDDFGNTYSSPDHLWGYVWGPFGLHHWTDFVGDFCDFGTEPLDNDII